VLLSTNTSMVTQVHYTDNPGYWGGLVSQNQSGVTSFYGYDGPGNTRILVSNAGSVLATYLYEAFGQEILTPSASNIYWFGGRFGYQRDVSDRYYLRARHLETANGRWISRDPVGFDGGDWNLYRYVHNRPLFDVDPSGLSCTCQLTYTGSKTRGNNSGVLTLTQSYYTLPPVVYDFNASSGLVGCGGESQCLQCRGPIPTGTGYTVALCEQPCNAAPIAQFSGYCAPISGNGSCTRTGLYIHQAHIPANPQSNGCIVLGVADIATFCALLALCTTVPVPMNVVQPVASAGSCSDYRQGLTPECARDKKLRNRCTVGCAVGK